MSKLSNYEYWAESWCKERDIAPEKVLDHLHLADGRNVILSPWESAIFQTKRKSAKTAQQIIIAEYVISQLTEDADCTESCKCSDYNILCCNPKTYENNQDTEVETLRKKCYLQEQSNKRWVWLLIAMSLLSLLKGLVW